MFIVTYFHVLLHFSGDFSIFTKIYILPSQIK